MTAAILDFLNKKTPIDKTLYTLQKLTLWTLINSYQLRHNVILLFPYDQIPPLVVFKNIKRPKSSRESFQKNS